MKKTEASLAWYGAAGAYLLLWGFAGVHDFQLWPQVTLLRGSTPDFASIFSQAHFLRYLLVYPIFFVAEASGVDANQIFGGLCFVMLFFIAKNCVRITQFYLRNNLAVIVLMLSMFFITVSLFMNGRIIFSFYGFSYLIVSIHLWEAKEFGNLQLFCRILVALFLCAVSTGTFLLCIISLLVWIVVFNGRSKGSLYFYMAAMLSVLSPLISLYIFKNINFYGGGFDGLVNMLNHGAGAVFHQLDSELLILLLLNINILLLFGFAAFVKVQKYRLLFVFFASSAFSGLFGYSTLTLGLIPLSILLIIVFFKVVSSGPRSQKLKGRMANDH